MIYELFHGGENQVFKNEFLGQRKYYNIIDGQSVSLSWCHELI
jgi:hypothetical protein